MGIFEATCIWRGAFPLASYKQETMRQQAIWFASNSNMSHPTPSLHLRAAALKKKRAHRKQLRWTRSSVVSLVAY